MSIEDRYPGCFKEALREFNETKDAAQTKEKIEEIECEEYISNFYKKRLIARLDLVSQLQHEIGNFARGNLAQAKRLLSLLDLEDESILKVCKHLNLINLKLDPALEDDLFNAIINHFASIKFNEGVELDSNSTYEKIFKNHISYESPRRDQPIYTSQVAQQFVNLIKQEKISDAFQLLITLEQIPSNLQVSRMHKPLLQKYLWNAINCNGKFRDLTGVRGASDRWSLQEAHLARNYRRFEFEENVAFELKQCLEGL